MMKNKFYLCSVFLLITTLYSCSKKDITSVNNADYQTLGAAAKPLLDSSTYISLKIEIQYMPGYAPDATAINNLVSFLDTYLNKPGGIVVEQKQITASGADTLNLNQIVTIEKNNRTAFTGGKTIAVHIFILDADYNIPNILGVSYWNTSICIFGKLINANSGGVGQVSRTTFYSTLLEHEFGHLMGLVDLGTVMQTAHKDNAHGNHCNNANCLMYYGVENNLLSGLTNNSVPLLDANCITDLKANGGK